MPIQFWVKGPDLKRMARELRESTDRTTQDAAEKAPKDITDNIKAGLAPDGRPQQKNPPGVRKRKRGKPPLVDTGRLSTPGAWRVDRQAGSPPHNFDVRPPGDRTDVVLELEAKGYRVLGVPMKTRQRMEAGARQIAEDVKRVARQTTRKHE